MFRPSVQPYLISLFRQDPAAFAQLKMPALIVQGSNDMQVGVGDAQALKAAKPDAELVLIDGMNHVMRIVPNDVKRQLASYKTRIALAAELGGESSNLLTDFAAVKRCLPSSPEKNGR
jgi:pimeloyl-ACP methyl ester carboxylesterase